MLLDIIHYDGLTNLDEVEVTKLKTALFQKGIVGISQVPDFQKKSKAYIGAARNFSALADDIKNQYAPNRDIGDTEGYELGAEWFKDQNGQWQIDDKKASYYAYVPDKIQNKWPKEVDFKTPYLALAELIFKTGKLVLNALGINDVMGIQHEGLEGYGRMLHYHKESDATNANPNWCGAHLDHGVFTGLLPAYYYRDGVEVDEPEEAGLFIVPTQGTEFEKINVNDKSILLFQVGEFGQLASNDNIRATKHFVKKANGNIERFTFALFYSAADNAVIQSNSILTKDKRYTDNLLSNGGINYGDWQRASFERYRASLQSKP